MEKWFVTTKKADFEGWARQFGISPVLARIIRNRDITSVEEVDFFLNGSLKDCHSPWLLHHMDLAVDCILKAIEEKLPIRVIGDYDVDGICSSYILTKGFKELGAVVDTAIPHRIHDGYGLNDNLIQAAHEDGIGLIVTCDNGISAAEQVRLAYSLGMKVVVTDHHEVPFVMEGEIKREVLPEAEAIIDPKKQEDHYPFPNICGGLVAYKLIKALYEKAKAEAHKDTLEELLEFAALATVCDVMELKDENRIIVKEGLQRMRNTKNLGLEALIRVNEIDVNKISAYHLGFVIGPCLNATGRLDTARRALELVQSQNTVEAMSNATELKNLNESRKNLTLQGVEEAEEYIQKNQMAKDKVLVVYLPEVHESLAGIIAGRIREKYNRPTFILTKGEEGVKGSGRSVEQFHMFEAMVEVKELFTKFGGHKLAAGLSMEEADIEELKRRMNENCLLTEEDFCPQVHIDVPMPLDYASLDLVEQLEGLEPFGVGNPKPLFAQKNLRFLAAYPFGKVRKMAKYKVVTEQGNRYELISFADPEVFNRFLEEKYGSGSVEKLYAGCGDFEVSVVYQLGSNTYMGQTSLQYIMQHFC